MARNPKLAELLAEYTRMANKCGNAHEAREFHDSLKADACAWSELEYRGVQEYDDESALELRNCARCGSTLAKIVSLIVA